MFSAGNGSQPKTSFATIASWEGGDNPQYTNLSIMATRCGKTRDVLAVKRLVGATTFVKSH